MKRYKIHDDIEFMKVFEDESQSNVVIILENNIDLKKETDIGVPTYIHMNGYELKTNGNLNVNAKIIVR